MRALLEEPTGAALSRRIGCAPYAKSCAAFATPSVTSPNQQRGACGGGGSAAAGTDERPDVFRTLAPWQGEATEKLGGTEVRSLFQTDCNPFAGDVELQALRRRVKMDDHAVLVLERRD